jgi:radical SAM protein with 4Fe4S-binding SPASM domain
MRYHLHYYLRFILKLHFRRLINLFKLQASYHVSVRMRKPLHWGLPASISVEPLTLCNLQCPECPSGQHLFTRPTGMADVSLYAERLKQLSPELIYLILYFQGEPLLHSGFAGMVQIAAQMKIFTATSTNAIYLTPKTSEQLILAGLDDIVVSLDGLDQETYAKYRRGGSYAKAVQGIRNLVEARKRLDRLNPFIRLQFIVMKHNMHQMEAVKKFGKELGVDRVELKTAQIYDMTDPNGIVPEGSKYARYKRGKDGLFELINPTPNRCYRMWSGAVITWDGTVVPCCYDKDADHALGSLKDSDFRTIWKSQAADVFRRKVFSNRKGIDMCVNCPEK